MGHWGDSEWNESHFHPCIPGLHESWLEGKLYCILDVDSKNIQPAWDPATALQATAT